MIHLLDKPQIKELEPQIREIFFLTSSRTQFESPVKKRSFYEKWTHYYYNNDSSSILVFLDSNENVTSYLMGTNDSENAVSYYESIHPSYLLFQDHFKDYPSHLHINTHPEHQGKKQGSQLINYYCDTLRNQDVKGTHIITAENAANVNFYRRCGFKHEVIRDFKGRPLLFMGKKLSYI